MESLIAGAQPEGVSFSRKTDSTLVISLIGSWRLRHGLPSSTDVLSELQKAPTPKQVAFDASALTGWDSGLISFLQDVSDACQKRGVAADRSGLPAGVK